MYWLVGLLDSPDLIRFSPTLPHSFPAAGPSRAPGVGSVDTPIPLFLSPTPPPGILPTSTPPLVPSANTPVILKVPHLNIPKVEMHTRCERPAKAIAKMKNTLMLAPSAKSKASKRKRSPSEEGEDGQSDKSFIANPPPCKRGRPRKNSPEVINPDLTCDKKRLLPPHQWFIGVFNVPTDLKHLFNKPFMPKPCVQCSMGKNRKEEKCQFQGWGYPCVPCKTAHFTCCECRPARLAPELIVSHIQDAVFDQQHIHANQAIIDS
ncbi:uncharacterized protein LACBIDRAFT_316736 [Laccaria bicolor S238N-H82]|uniref:Predicted protein n=1 Tax=Laccaria bicolor (strain S238N-H82 / ATCC MYA-4686) TaxID=486041 RepID=B0E570_LACBS|nr:uncharacterized protein LACBIDRAFT_316736 [Laccaria bicolor S238N-H82]EDQ98011.1 predicted protein [Laccaria bicolor S238N-H82]|eukprot:XP_001891338.1 predicted protein [Laccaria bicolor S238N-H82]